MLILVKTFCIAMCSAFRESADQSIKAIVECRTTSEKVPMPGGDRELASWLEAEEETLETGTQCWKTMDEAGVTEEKIQQWIEDTRQEATNIFFRNKLLSSITKSGISKKDGRFPVFDQTTDAEFDFQVEHSVIADEHGNTTTQNENKFAIFVLGASSTGKTTVTASALAKHSAFAQFPLMTMDGADWRDSSKVWKRHAKDGFVEEGRTCHYKDYYKKVFQKVRPEMDAWTMSMVRQHQPKTVVIPDTAVPCVFPSWYQSCPIQYKIDKMVELGYKPVFFVIIADKEEVQRRGEQRQETEGKAYSPKTFELAYLSAFNLACHRSDATWKYFYNSFDNSETSVQELEQEDFLSRTSGILEQASWIQSLMGGD